MSQWATVDPSILGPPPDSTPMMEATDPRFPIVDSPGLVLMCEIREYLETL